MLFIYYFVALVPGQVQNLRSARNADRTCMILKWDKPNNIKLAREVTAYEIRYKHCNNSKWSMCTVKAPKTSNLLKRKSGFISLMTYDFEVRARNAECEGEWRRMTEFAGICCTFYFRMQQYL